MDVDIGISNSGGCTEDINPCGGSVLPHFRSLHGPEPNPITNRAELSLADVSETASFATATLSTLQTPVSLTYVQHDRSHPGKKL